MNNDFLKKFISQVAELADTAFKSVRSETNESLDENQDLDVDDLDGDAYDRERKENSEQLSLEYDENRKRISDKWKRY
jgi:hypothetical protein